MRSLCNSDMVEVYICDELIEEFIRIVSQEKISKYTSDERVMQTMNLMKASCVLNNISKNAVSPRLRDMNDLYLLAFADTVNADFILTGDKDLLSLQSHHQTRIVTYKEFQSLFEE